MADMVTKQELEAAKIDVKNAGEAVNEEKVITPRYGNSFKSIPLIVKEAGQKTDTAIATLNTKADEVIAQGFYKGFATEALLLAAKPSVSEMRARADDTRKIWRWNRTSGEGAVPVTGTWADTGLSELDLARNYADTRAGTALTSTSDLNSLAAGNYYLTTANLNTIFDNGTYLTLNYPADTKKGGAVKLSVVVAPPSNYSVQTIEFVSQGTRYTRQGAVGATFQPWAAPVNYGFGTVSITDNLNDYVKAGSWGISMAAVTANSPTGLLGYPVGLIATPLDFKVSTTDADRTVQTIIAKNNVYRRTLKTTTKAVIEDWTALDGGLSGGGVFASIALGMASTRRDGDMFWVYPTVANALTNLTLYKRLTASTQEIAFVQSNLDNYLINEGASWE